MPSPTDFGRRGQAGFLRDPGNEQIGTLAPNQVFTGEWTRVDKVASFAILYGTHVPFTMQIQWSADGETLDTDPFATITPQVRSRLGLYSVISFQSTFFRPFYRIKVTNAPSQQFFAVSDALLLNTVFDGYLIDVDGPIPVLGLAMLNHGLAWGRSPSGWSPQQLTAGLNQKIAIAEDLLGLATDAKLDAILAKLSTPSPVPLDAASLAALEQVNVILDAASLASLESITVQNNVATDMLDRAARLVGVVSVSNFPPGTPTVTAAGTPTRLTLAATTIVKATPGVLERVVINKISAAAAVTLTLYNALTADPTKIIAAVLVGATAPGSSGIAAPASLDYFATFSTGLTAVLSAVGADVTLVWR